MPILQNAKKALRSSERKAKTNRVLKATLKTASDKVRKQPSTETASGFFSVLDRAVNKHILHRNKAARLKSQIAKLIAKV